MLVNRKNFSDDLISQKGNDYSVYGFRGHWCLYSAIWNYKRYSIPVPEVYSCSMFVKNAFCDGKKNTEFETAEIGDMVFFENNNPYDGVDHIGIVIGNDGKNVTVWEGNTAGNGDGDGWWKSSCVTINTYSYAKLHSEPLNILIDMSSFFTDGEEKQETVDYSQIIQELTDLRNENNALRVEIQCLNEKISKAKDDLE